MAIKKALQKAQQSASPTYIEVKTIIGRGAKHQGTPTVHGAPLIDLVATKNFYHWHHKPFEIPEETYQFYREKVGNRVNKKYKD